MAPTHQHLHQQLTPTQQDLTVTHFKHINKNKYIDITDSDIKLILNTKPEYVKVGNWSHRS